MASYNRVIMIGNLTRDPDCKQLASGQMVCRLGLASNRQFKNKQTGQMVQEVCFIDIDVWGAQAETSRNYLVKGRSILVEGRLKLDSWQDPDGNKRSKHSIVADRITFLGTGAQADESDESSMDGSADMSDAFTPAKPVEVKKPRAAKSSPSGEVNFKNEDPFESDLPF